VAAADCRGRRGGGTYLFEVRSSSSGGRRLGLGGEAGGGALAGAIEAEHGQALGEGVAQPRRPPLAPAHPPVLHPRHPARFDGGWIHHGGGGMRRRREGAPTLGYAKWGTEIRNERGRGKGGLACGIVGPQAGCVDS